MATQKRSNNSASLNPIAQSSGWHSTLGLVRSTTKILKCNSPNCANMRDIVVGKSAKNTRIKEFRVARNPALR